MKKFEAWEAYRKGYGLQESDESEGNAILRGFREYLTLDVAQQLRGIFVAGWQARGAFETQRLRDFVAKERPKKKRKSKKRKAK